MSVVWIVHRDPNERAGLARLAGVSEAATLGAPGDAVFRDAPAPDAVVLGLAGDLESELEFVHRTSAAARAARWILVGEAAQLASARKLFDVLPASFLTHPPSARALRDAVNVGAPQGAAIPLALSQRPARDALADRFARAFSDLDAQILMRALDPRLADVPLLLLGERGTGRETLARYLHHFGGTAGGVFVELPCTPQTSAGELLQRIAGAQTAHGATRAATLWLAEPSALAPAVQRVVQSWITYGLPPGTASARRLRWMATEIPDTLEPGLQRALAGLSLHVPPLRERREMIPNLVATTADNWCRARGVATRRFAEHTLAVLEEYPWPGNLRELEAVIEHSLAASGADPLGPEHLRLDGELLAPLAVEAPEAAPAPEAPQPSALVRVPVPTAIPRDTSPDEDVDVDTLLAALGPDEGTDEMAAPLAAPHVPTTSVQQLAAAVGHELRKPLSAIRTFAELLPERHADPDFRDEFRRQVGESVAHSEQTVARLESLAVHEQRAPQPVDVSGLLEELLGKRREHIRARRLVVLEELDPARSKAFCDPHQLRVALEAVLDKTLSVVPERGDVYLASRRLDAGLRAGPCVRLLLRLRAPQARNTETARVAAPAAAVDFAVAELLVNSQGGSLTLDASDRGETILLLDLPAEPEAD